MLKNQILLIFITILGSAVLSGRASFAETVSQVEAEGTSFENVVASLADPFGLLSGSAEAISVPFRQPNQFAEPSSRLAQPLKGRPNLNFYPYSTGYRIDRLTLKPVAEYYRVWDNNLFRTENGRKEDTVHRIITGFHSSYALDERGQNRVRLSYLATLEYFDRHSNQDHDDHAVGTGGNLKLGELRLSGDARWARASSRGNINLPDPQSTSETATARGLAELPMGAAFAEFEVNNLHIDSLVRANARFDRNELSMAPRLGVNLNAVDQLFFEYNRIQITYPNADDRDGAANQESVGLRKYLSEKTSLTGLVGYQSRIYDADERPDFFGVVASARLQHKFGEDHGITIQVDRKPAETSFANQSFLIQNGLTYDYRHPLLTKGLQLIKRGGVSYQTYSQTSAAAGDDETRREYVWNEGIGCEYILPGGFSSFYFLYHYSAIESNTANLAIDDQQITYGFKGYF